MQKDIKLFRNSGEERRCSLLPSSVTLHMSYLEWAECQLAEIELLTSMFPTQEELEITDQLALAELRDFVEGPASTDSPPASRPQFFIKQILDTASMERTDAILACAYPSEYPSVLPVITVRVKVLTWKKIMIRHREDIPLDRQGEDSRTGESIDSLRKFTGFEEAMFDPHGNRGNHMDLGQLYQFLNEKGCCDVFQIYFGIEGR